MGLLLGTVAQGIFAKEITSQAYLIATAVLTIAAILIVVSIALSRED